MTNHTAPITINAAPTALPASIRADRISTSVNLPARGYALAILSDRADYDRIFDKVYTYIVSNVSKSMTLEDIDLYIDGTVRACLRDAEYQTFHTLTLSDLDEDISKMPFDFHELIRLTHSYNP